MKTGYKIIILVAVASCAAYVSLTINTVAGLSLLAISPLLLCLGICGVMGSSIIGGTAWFSRSKTRPHDEMRTDKKSRGCC